ncbi:MAG: hypothetical protein MRY83_15640 [Flavobacteriales bacterium]|nr:hypothetical protein [Flavobacteriales bacterium]
MKNILLLLIPMFLLTNYSEGQAVYQGKVLAEVYYGGPNFWKSVLEAIYEDDAYYGSLGTFNATGLGPMGIRGEYLVADQIGIGVDVLYSRAGIEVDYQSEVWDNASGTWQTVTYTGKASTTKISFMPSFNFHFGNSENFDGYMSIAAGYKTRNTTSESNDPNEPDASIRGAAIPVDFRMAVGGRYFFTENIGINGSIGVSGPLVSGGLTVRL